MGQKSGPVKEPTEQLMKEIRRATRRQFSAEEKIRIVLCGLRGEDSIAELCRREGIVQNLYYRWSKDFLEAGKSDWLAIRPGPRRRTSNARPSPHAACSTNGEPRNVINQTSQSLPPFALLAVSKTLMTDT